MRKLVMWILGSSLLAAGVSCRGDDEAASTTSRTATSSPVARRVKQVPPPLDLRTLPADATRTASGLAYKTLVANREGTRPKGNDVVLARYTGWRRSTGETFVTAGHGNQPVAIDLAHAAPGFREALPLLHKGETAVLWMPPEAGASEELAYEVEVVDVAAPPGRRGSGHAAPAVQPAGTETHEAPGREVAAAGAGSSR